MRLCGFESTLRIAGYALAGLSTKPTLANEEVNPKACTQQKQYGYNDASYGAVAQLRTAQGPVLAG
jgi:hypothetical protein